MVSRIFPVEISINKFTRQSCSIIFPLDKYGKIAYDVVIRIEATAGLVLILRMYYMKMCCVKKGEQFMKRKIFSLMLALTVCVSMVFSTSNPVKAEPAHAESTHASCEHETPPTVEIQDLGYNFNDTHHWTMTLYIVRCSRCNNVMETRTVEGTKEGHIRHFDNRKCDFCDHTL